MSLPDIVHMTAGGLAIVLGFVALFATKGARLHRRIGNGFVVTMLTLALTGVGIAIAKGDVGSMMGGSLAAYLVATGMITVQPHTITWRRALGLAALVGVAVAGFSLVRLGIEFSSTGARIFYPSFALVALLAVSGDVRILRAGPPVGARRLARHLWRMCMALWIATASFFLGPRRRVELLLPDALAVTPVVVIPVLTVLLTMGYWIWRLRSRTPLRGITVAGSESRR
jgi:hypothetical protein